MTLSSDTPPQFPANEALASENLREELERVSLRLTQAERRAAAAEDELRRAKDVAILKTTLANRAEALLIQATLAVRIAETRAKAAEDAAAQRSFSWRRLLHPKHVARGLARHGGRYIMGHPRLVDFIKPRLEAHPWLWEKLKRAILFEGAGVHALEQMFTLIELPGLTLHFANGPLMDTRGIGRVAREQLQELLNLADSNRLPNGASGAVVQGDNKHAYFFTSIHWCPEILPEPSYVMIHDVIPLLFPEDFPVAIQNEWHRRYKAIARQATRIVTISQSSADDIARVLDISRDKIDVIYNGVTSLPVAEKSDFPLVGKPYLVFLGSHDHHKNVDIVLRALTDPQLHDVHLVLIGDNKGCLGQVRKLGLERRTSLMGRLADDEMGYVVQNALAMVFPSFYEGFGLPPMEAALLGTPTICSRRPAMTELMEDVCLFADPESPEEWARAIADLKGNPPLRESLAKAALERVETFSWPQTVHRLVDVLKS